MFFPLSNLYSNALLGSLNARYWFRRGAPKEAVTIPLASLGGSSAGGRAGPGRGADGGMVRRDAAWDVCGADGVPQDERKDRAGPRLTVEVQTDVVKAAL